MRGAGRGASLERLCAENVALAPGETVLAAVSGGGDSVALAALLAGIAARSGATLVLGHVDHGVRPDAGRDEGVVLAVASALGLRVVVRAIPPGPADEARLRDERYAALVALAAEVGARRVFAAHHAQDQTETVLLALFRGAGTRGLGGMRPIRPLAPGLALERPLLGADASELLAYVRDRRLPYAVDPTNADGRYARNAVREVLGGLRERFPGLDRAVARGAALSAAADVPRERDAARAEIRALVDERTGLRDVGYPAVEAVARAVEAARPGRHFLRRGVEVAVSIVETPAAVATAPLAVGEVLFDRRAIAAAVERLAGEIAATYAGRDLTLICVLEGALFFTADLARALPSRLDVRIACVSLSSYRGTESSGTVRSDSPLPDSLDGAEVLIVEDIADTGRTLAWLRERIEAEAPASVRTCVLFDKPSRRVVATPLDFIGITVPDAFIVGYGLDHQEKYRHLPYVAVLRPEGTVRASAPAEPVTNSDSRTRHRE